MFHVGVSSAVEAPHHEQVHPARHPGVVREARAAAGL